MSNKPIEPQNMSESTSQVFAGKYKTETNKKMYAETADYFANEIKARLPKTEGEYTLLDIGSHQGELMQDILSKLPDYKFKTIAIDISEDSLSGNNISDRRIIANAEELPLDDEIADVVIVRYLLQWNDAERQKKILQEIARVTKGFALVEHVGSDIVDTENWRTKMGILLEGHVIPKLKRGEHFFSSRDEVENWMNGLGIKFERLRERIIQNGSDVYIERFNLTQEEAEKARIILGDKDFFHQTDWIIYPAEN